ncbi:16456_t:CDS:1, partial [Racocetra persica]
GSKNKIRRAKEKSKCLKDKNKTNYKATPKNKANAKGDKNKNR